MLAVPTFAFASALSDGPATTMTGCLQPDGNLVKFKTGQDPASACGDNDRQVQVAGGDITAVAVGPGLVGGGSLGEVSLDINPAFKLRAGALAARSPRRRAATIGSARPTSARWCRGAFRRELGSQPRTRPPKTTAASATRT